MITTAHHFRDDASATLAIPCPTCWIGPADRATAAVARFSGEYGYDVAPATCPTCLVTSVEWGLVAAMDAVLAELLGLTRLEAAVDAAG